MVRWFRRDTPASAASRSSAVPAGPAPSTPGGSGGSGFGGVGATPSGGSSTATPGDGGTRRGLSRLAGGGGSTPEEQRFGQVYAADRVGPMPYPNQASPDVAAARGRVRALVNDLLPGGVDEGSGAALDPLIASWASGWLARIDSEHADHHAVVDRLVGGARQQLAEAEASHERDRRALEIARHDYTEARERLLEPLDEPTEEPAATGPYRPSRASSAGAAAGTSPGGAGEPLDPPTDPPTAPARSRRRPTGGVAEDVPGPPEPATGPMPLPRPQPVQQPQPTEHPQPTERPQTGPGAPSRPAPRHGSGSGR